VHLVDANIIFASSRFAGEGILDAKEEVCGVEQAVDHPANAILRFIADPAVPFSNNIAESTLRKQGHSMLEVLRRAFIGDPIMPVA
jgi:hypothetical protein